MTTITAVGNQKGGVGKTTTTLGLASADAHLGKRVLVIDMDPQHNATVALGGMVEGELNVYDALVGTEPGGLADVIRRSTWKGVDVAPGAEALSLFERDSVMMAEHRLKLALDGVDLGQYDVVYIDLPAQLGRLALNGLVVADQVVVVTVPEAWAVDGVAAFLKTVGELQRQPMLNPGLRVAGILLNSYDGRLNEHQTRRAELHEAYGDLVFDVRAPRLSSAGNMASYGQDLYMAKGGGWRRLVAVYELLALTMNNEGARR